MTRKDAIFREKRGDFRGEIRAIVFSFKVPFIAVKNSRFSHSSFTLKIGRLTHKKSSHYLEK